MIGRDDVRACIRQVLQEHVAEPFFNLREADLQARLWALLRARLNPPVVSAKVAQHRTTNHRHGRDFMTSRVHLEMKVGGTEKSDIVILKADQAPRLKCYPPGPTDVVAALDPEDIDAIIEVKAAPSNLKGQGLSFAQDILKLNRLRGEHPAISFFFVLIDKSVCVPDAASSTPLRNDAWTSHLPFPLEPLTVAPSAGTFIELWDLDGSPIPSPRTRYIV